MTVRKTFTTDHPQSAWPELPGYEAWRESCTTLHMWTQIVGKIRLELSPWINHSWGSALYVTTRGLATSPIPYDNATFNIEFNFVDHALHITTSAGEAHTFRLAPMPVAEFYRKTLQGLHGMGIRVKIFTRPVEVEEAIPFEEDDLHVSYDSEIVNRFWQALVQTDRVFKTFRARFRGKVSPVHFFWGAFDLAVTRFSGRTAPLHPGGAPNCPDWVMQEAYSHEVASAGFWPGAGLGEAAFYAYAYPEPEGYRFRPAKPDAAYYSDTLNEYILPYEAVRSSAIPAQTLLEFLESTHESAAELAGWNREALEICFVPAGRSPA